MVFSGQERSFPRAVAGWTTLVENDLPFAVGAPAPHRVEGSELLPFRIEDRAARQAKRTRVKHGSVLGLPRERSGLVDEEAPPGGRDRIGAPHGPLPAEKDRF